MRCRPSCNTSQASSPEHRIGTRLIERGDVHFQLTPAGLDEARLALAQAERALERARQATRANTGRLTLDFLLGERDRSDDASDDHIAAP
jgi:DNA-binding transcriptional LysR family regulator